MEIDCQLNSLQNKIITHCAILIKNNIILSAETLKFLIIYLNY